MNIKDIFRGRNKQAQEIELLNQKISNLESAIEKSNLNDTLAGIVGNNFVTLTQKNTNAYDNNYTIYRGINMLSDNISALPLRIYRGEEPMNPDFKLPRGFDLNNPHPKLSLNELLYTCCVYFFYRGEFMVYIDLEDGFSLEPVNPKLMKREKNGDWKWNNKLYIPNEQLVYAKFLNPDADRGLSPVDVVKDELMAYSNSTEYIKKFFENFAQIGGVLYDELGQASKSDMESLVDQFNTKHQGAGNAYKVLGLPRGIKHQDLSQTIREMQFLDSQKEFRDKFLSVLGIHKAVFGVTDQVDRAVAETAMRMLWNFTLRPAARKIETKLNQHLMKRYFPGYTVAFDYSDVEALQENRESVLNQAKIMRELGYTTNEINEYFDLGMDDVTDPIGDMRFVPTNLIPLEDLLLNEPLEPQKAVEIKDNLTKIAEMLDKTDKIDKSKQQYIRRFDRVQRSSEKSMTGKLRKHFSQQLGKVVGLVKENKSIEKINEIELLAEIKNLLQAEKQTIMDTMRPVYEEGSKAAVNLALTTIGQTATDQYSEAIVESMVNKISGIHNHTYTLIRNEIKESIAAGESVDSMVKRIQNVYKFNASRARIIARTESANLVNRSTDEQYRANNIKKKQWLDANDGNVRPTHKTNDNLGVVDYDYVYPNGLRFPGDPNGSAAEVIQCRCSLIPVIE